MSKHEISLAYYGDDFTGSTDALDFLCRAGVKTVLFIETPDAEKLSRFKDVQAIGIAGTSRSLTPEAIEKELTQVFSALKQLNPTYIHYKVCSTFDSAPHIGSIGKAIDVGINIFGKQPVPLLVGAPALGRYCAFGNLFARMGIGSSGQIYRLDRHPSMSKHPITPADESDLRLHLSKQTDQKIGLIDITDLENGYETCLQKINQLTAENNTVILFDALTESHLKLIGKLLEAVKQKKQTLFSVGSSAIEMALGNHLPQQQNQQINTTAGKASPILVLSGSCSPVTSGQITYALANGFREISVDTSKIIQNDNTEDLISSYTIQATEILKSGKSLIIHTSKGPNDERLQRSAKILKAKQKSSAELLGSVLGLIANKILEKISLTRLVIAGGDTSGFAAKAMGVEALEMVVPFVVGAPICKAYTAPDYPANGIEINFKGGQVGAEDYFVKAAQGM